MRTIIDNSESNFLEDFLNETLPNFTQLDVCVGYFNLRGWRKIRNAVLEMDERGTVNPKVRLLVGMALSGEDEIRNEFRIARKRLSDGIALPDAVRLAKQAVEGFARQLTWGAPTNDDLRGLQALKDDLLSGRVEVKFAAREPLHAKLYVCHSDDGLVAHQAIVGSSNFTGAGFRGQGELNLVESDKTVAPLLAEWFSARWNDLFSIDITEMLAAIIDESWAREVMPTPRLVHLKIAYELSKDARSGLNLDLPQQFRNILAPHQESAVRVATKILERRGLVIIGDVVGLGKTMIASAVAATFGENVLVLCPKTMVTNWKDYLDRYHIPGRVMSLSMVSRELDTLRRYKLVIIDESHNLRHESTINWAEIRRYIEINDSNVVLVTATLYNASLRDIGSQIGLKIDKDLDLGIRPESLISKIGKEGLAAKTNGRLTTLAAFEQSDDSEDWQRLLEQFLVRRTRRHLETRYGEVDPVTGRIYIRFANNERFAFPKRVPKPLEYTRSPDDVVEQLASITTFNIINNLTYARYQLGKYLRDDIIPVDQVDEELIGDLKKSVQTAAGFIRTTTLKRMSSSAFAFMLTIEKMLAKAHILLYAVENRSPFPIGTFSNWTVLDLDNEEDDEDELDEGVVVQKSVGRTREEWNQIARDSYEGMGSLPLTKIRWIGAERFDLKQLAIDLQHDIDQLQSLIDNFGTWDVANDSRLASLAALVNSQPVGGKVLVFSEYRDTVDYIVRNLPKKCPGRKIEGVNGKSQDPTLLARRFSPHSNEKLGGLPQGTDEIDVLISTDVLSEGQNLQDSAIVVNWDLPWTIIKVIQRAGRVDRIGQVADEIEVYTFMPHDGINDVIQLREKLINRFREFAETIPSDENFALDKAPIESQATQHDDFIEGLWDGRIQLEDEEGEVDSSSFALGIWEGATDRERELASRLPDVVFTAKAVRDINTGVVVYCRSLDGVDALAFIDSNGNSSMKTPIEILKITDSDPSTPAVIPWDSHHELVKQAVSTTIHQQMNDDVYLMNAGDRRKIMKFLREFREQERNAPIDSGELDELITEIATHPVRESIRLEVSRILRSARLPGNDLHAVEQLLELHRGGVLVEDLREGEQDISIVCSMGLV